MRFPSAKHLLPAIVAVGVLCATVAFAQTAEHRRACEGEDGAPAEQRIAACTAVIKAGRDKGEKLAAILR